MTFNAFIDDAYFQARVNADKLKNMLKSEGYGFAADELDRVLYYFAAAADKALHEWGNDLLLALENDDRASAEAKDFIADAGIWFEPVENE